MAEISTIARPYAEALFQVAKQENLQEWADTVSSLALIAADPQVGAIVGDPHTTDTQLFDLFSGVLGGSLKSGVQGLLRTLIENGRLSLLPEIARQFAFLKNAHEGIADADITSAFALDDAQVAELVAALERKFAIKLRAKVTVDPSLIGGVRVAVGDEVLDSSVKTRLEQMRTTLTA